ncbi:hypothetical protein KK060_00560 [Fulvivirgaceae bacterium PWU20]|uniref:Tetratricopeptide repeat protein n=2 Tax=Chryseosolibacter indicus TaxID=2782351 RepID=A0ABS5VM06_9BACT|nr:hypothetical protein [Chryseosolibacter indicus]
MRISFLFLLCCTSCATYYQQNYNFNSEFEKGDLKKALQTLQSSEKQGASKSRFIYYVNNGLLLSILGKYEESNSYFEKAFLFGEDYRINYLDEAASFFTNPHAVTYKGEDHEHLMLLYFKALNFLKMNRPEDALVECRRLNIRLNQLSDRYSSEKKYQRDAFVHTLMGIIYQSTKDFNNAFIAYRNAVEIYENDYATMFGLTVPEQLKKDLLNTAWWTGFKDEFERFKTKFNMPDYEPVQPEAELVFFWHNGLAPVKSEWSINFVITHHDDFVVFSNDDMGVSFPFQVEKKKDRSDVASLEVFRVAFPKYVERPSYFHNAKLEMDSMSFPLEQTENISKIAFYSLQQRMMQEFGKGLLRAAMKKVTEHSVRKEDETIGALIGLVNAMTEKADTRNWQTLPHAIYYSRVPLKEGENNVKFVLDDKTDYSFTYKASRNQTLFHTFSSLETSSVPYRLVGN